MKEGADDIQHIVYNDIVIDTSNPEYTQITVHGSIDEEVMIEALQFANDHHGGVVKICGALDTILYGYHELIDFSFDSDNYGSIHCLQIKNVDIFNTKNNLDYVINAENTLLLLENVRILYENSTTPATAAIRIGSGVDYSTLSTIFPSFVVGYPHIYTLRVFGNFMNGIILDGVQGDLSIVTYYTYIVTFNIDGIETGFGVTENALKND